MTQRNKHSHYLAALHSAIRSFPDPDPAVIRIVTRHIFRWHSCVYCLREIEAGNLPAIEGVLVRAFSAHLSETFPTRKVGLSQKRRFLASSPLSPIVSLLELKGAHTHDPQCPWDDYHFWD